MLGWAAHRDYGGEVWHGTLFSNSTCKRTRALGFLQSELKTKQLPLVRELFISMVRQQKLLVRNFMLKILQTFLSPFHPEDLTYLRYVKISAGFLSVHECLCMYLLMCLLINVCACVFINICVYVHIYECVCVGYMYILMNVCMYSKGTK